MWKHPVAFATLAAALAACGTEKDPVEIGPNTKIDDPVAYFGLEPCTCYDFEPVSGASQARLGIAVEAVSTSFPGNPDGAEEYALVYRIAGTTDRIYVLRPTDPVLELRQVQLDFPTGSVWTADPPIPYVQGPIEPKDRPVEATVQMTEIDPEGITHDPVEVAFRADYVGESDLTWSVDGETEVTGDAVRVSFRRLPFEERFRWFVPEVGPVRVEYDTGSGRTIYQLVRKRMLDSATCPSDNLATRPGGCGTSIE